MTFGIRWPQNALRSSAARATLILAVGAVVGQAIQALMTPALTRVFTPIALGSWAILQSYVALNASVAGLRYELAIPLLRLNDEANQVATLQTILSVASAIAFLIAFISLGVLPLDGFAPLSPEIGIFLLFLLMICGSQIQLGSQYCIRDRAFVRLALVRLISNPFATIAQIGLGLVLAGSAGALIIGAAFATVLASITAGKRAFQALAARSLDLKRLRIAARAHARFPLFAAPYGLVTAMRDRGLLLLVASYGGLASLGTFVAAQRLVAIPVALMSAAAGPVLHQRLASEAEPHVVQPLVEHLLRIAIWMGVPFFGVLAYSSDYIVSPLLGAAWDGAAGFVTALSVSGFTLFVSGLFDRSFDVAGQQKIALAIETSSSVFSVAVGWVLLANGVGPVTTIAVVAVLQAVHHVVWVAGVWRVLRFSLLGAMRLLLHFFAVSVMTIALLAGLTFSLAR